MKTNKTKTARRTGNRHYRHRRHPGGNRAHGGRLQRHHAHGRKKQQDILKYGKKPGSLHTQAFFTQ